MSRKFTCTLALFCTGLLCASVALASAGDPKKMLRPSGQAYARSIVLGKPDLPGSRWRRKSTDFGQPNPPCFVQHYSLSALTETGEAGFTYSRGGGRSVIESDGHVFVTLAQAQRAIAILSKRGLGGCYARSIVTSLKRSAPGVSAKPLKVERLRIGVPAGATTAFRIIVRFKPAHANKSLDLTYVTVSIQIRRALGVLDLIRTRQTWSASVIHSLAAKLAARMRKH